MKKLSKKILSVLMIIAMLIPTGVMGVTSSAADESPAIIIKVINGGYVSELTISASFMTVDLDVFTICDTTLRDGEIIKFPIELDTPEAQMYIEFILKNATFYTKGAENVNLTCEFYSAKTEVKEEWQKDKVKIEFRYADTKEIIDTSDEYIYDHPVAFNFYNVDGSHWYQAAKNGILYLDLSHFPLKSCRATWSSAFGDHTEYVYETNEVLKANAGDTLIVYMSTNKNQGSVVTKVSGGAKENYGANNPVSTIEGEIAKKAKELAEYIGEYISLINGSEKDKNKKNVGNSTLDKAAKAIMNADAYNKIYAVEYKVDYEYALCYALATVFQEETLAEIDLGKINLDKSKEEISLNLTQKLIKSFRKINKTVEYGNYKIDITIHSTGEAFAGTYSVYKNNKSVVMNRLFTSSVKATEAALKSYFSSMTDLVNDLLKVAMSAIFTELSDVTGLTAYREEALSDSVKNALLILEKKGFGKVINILKSGKAIYTNIKALASAKDDLTVSNILNTEKKIREIYDIVKSNEFTSSKISDANAKAIIKKIENARTELYNLLYNKLYGINRDGAGFTAIGNWITSKFLCPVDIEVYNADGQLIGYVDTTGRHEEFIYYTDGIYIEVHGDEKFVYYPADKTVTFKFYGTDNGEMTYSLENLVDGESVDRLNYYNVPLTPGIEYSQTIEGNPDLADAADTLVLIGDETIYADEYISATDDTAHVRVLYSSTEGGSVSGDMYYPKGDCATLYAYEEEGYTFKGWFEDNECISEEEIYRFAAVRDVFLEARFGKTEEQFDEDEESTVLDRIILSESELFLNLGEQENLYYIAVPSMSNVSLKWSSSDPSVATVDENGLVTAVSQGATVISIEDTITNISVQCRVVVDGESSCSLLGHDFKDWYYITLADCSSNGAEKRECLYCDYSETRDIPAIGHSYDSGVCITCGDSKIEICSHLCHKDNAFVQFIWKIINFLSKIFGASEYCTCGMKHW